MTVCNYVLVGGLALVLACLVATHLDGMRYETCSNQELREESQRKSWNEIVNQHWSWECFVIHYIFEQKYCTIFAGQFRKDSTACCLPSDSKFTNLFWSCFVCLSILNLKSFSKIIATSFYIEGLSREHCLASLNSFSFLFLALANCRRSSRCSWTQRRLAETPRGPRRQYYHREPACAQTRRRGRPAKNLKFQYLFLFLFFHFFIYLSSMRPLRVNLAVLCPRSRLNNRQNRFEALIHWPHWASPLL